MSVVSPPPSSTSSYPRPPMRSPSEPSVSSATKTNESVCPLRPRRHSRYQTARMLKFPVQQFARVLDAVDPFVESVQSSWPSSAVIRLHVTVPTSPTANRDLHDVHTLQNNLFGFLHHVVQGLRKKGIWATYHLSFSLASVCIVRALPSTIPPREEHEEQVLLVASKFDTSDASITLNTTFNATLVEVENVPALIIS